MKKILKGIGWLLLFLFALLNMMAAFHAYKFTHFYEPSQVVNTPIDKMTDWQKTSAILFGIHYSKKPISDSPATSALEKYEVKTEDGLTLRGWQICNKRADTEPKAIILFHGHGGNRGDLSREAEVFEKMGYCVFMTDFRAHGESDGNVCTIGYDEAKDVKAVYEDVKKNFGNKIVLWGVSLGAATILKAMADNKDIQPEKIILQMPFGSLTDAVNGRLRIMQLPQQPMGTLLTFWGGLEHGFWAFNHKPFVYARQVHTPVLLQWGRIDPRVTESETNAIFTNLASASKKLVIYEHSGHEDLLKSEPEKWLKTVSGFLNEK